MNIAVYIVPPRPRSENELRDARVFRLHSGYNMAAVRPIMTLDLVARKEGSLKVVARAEKLSPIIME